MHIRKSLSVKSARELQNNHSLSQSQNQTKAIDIQDEKIRISIKLPYVPGTGEELRLVLKSFKIRSTFDTESTLPKLLCKPKDWVAKEYENNIGYETDCSNYEAVGFGESIRSLKSRSDKHKKPAKNCDCE